jgi:DNA-binding CsgD family transcriptional regulator
MTRSLSPFNTHPWTVELAELLESAAVEPVWSYVLDVLQESFNISSLSVILYSGDTMPEAKFSRAMDDPHGKRIAAYLQGAYLLDPFFDAIQKSRMSGCYALSEVAPDRFMDGQYYKGFFTKYGLKDEVNLFFPLDSEQTVAISLGRSLGSRLFGARALSFLSSVNPFLRKLVERLVIDESQLITHLDRGVRSLVHARLKRALETAGRSLLSPREKDVLDHLLRGFSAKATAEYLNVTQGTVRLHRHNLYAKLEVTSQSELFALVLEALVEFNNEGTEDSLASRIASRRGNTA